MEDKDFKTTWKGLVGMYTDSSGLAGMYTDSSLLITDDDSKSLWEALIKSYPTSISSSTSSAPTISNTIEYWTKTQWEFLKQCCENDLKLKSLRVNGEFGVTISYDITFGYLGNKCTETFRITSQVADDYAGSYDYEYVSSTYSDSIELPIKLKYIMRAVYNHYIHKLTKP